MVFGNFSTEGNVNPIPLFAEVYKLGYFSASKIAHNMPTFPQFAIESLAVFMLLLGYYQITHRHHISYKAKRWQLRLLPVLACTLPMIPALNVVATVEVPEGVHVMSIGHLLNFELPAYSIKISTLFLALYFAGVVYTSFRFADRIWAVSQFLQSNGNSATNLAAWQANPTAIMGHLLLNFEQMSEEEKRRFANQWLPIHPVFGWEAFLVELSVIANWWNPLAHLYRRRWAELYAGWQTERRPLAGIFNLNMLGYGAIAGSLAGLFYWFPLAILPSHHLGEMAGRYLDKTIMEKIVEKPHEYLVEWGELKLPLKKFANPNGFSAELEVELIDFQKNIKKELRIIRDGKPMKPGTLSMLYKSYNRGRQSYLNGIDPKKVKLLDRQDGTLFNDSLGLGDELVLFGDAEEIYLSRIEIKIKDPEAGYEPPIFVPEISQLEPQMYYQIVARKGKRALVKIDPDHPNTPRILQLYGDVNQYEIVYLPGFRTSRHYLTEAETLASKVAAANTDLTFMERDAFYLPEYQGCYGKDVHMAWGGLEASPSSVNYPLDSFLLSIAHEPILHVGEDSLEIVSFELILAGKKMEAKSYHTYRICDLSLRGIFRNLQDETSIYFDKIVVKDENGEQLLFPASFAFHTGKPKKYSEFGFIPGKNYIFKEGAKPELTEFYIPGQDSMINSFRQRFMKKVEKTKS